MGDLSCATIFRGLASEAIDKLRSRERVLSFEMGEVLFEHGQEAEELLILQKGAVELSFPVSIMGVTRQLTLESKLAGDVVAWSALVSPYRFTLTGRCARNCAVTGLSREALHDCFDADPAVGYLFMRNLAGVIGQRLQTVQSMWVQDLQAMAGKELE